MTIFSNGQLWKCTEFIENKSFYFDKKKILNILSKKDIYEAYSIISKWENYVPTPLLELNKLSKELGLNKIFYKNEDKRFNLKSFKALGGAYAVEKVSKEKKNITISTATAGNHGRSVAWGAKKLGLKCKVFVSEYVTNIRIKAIKELGADLIKVKGNYQSSLTECIKQSIKNNWSIVQDVAWNNYTTIPKYTMAGYSVMMKEIADQVGTNKISHVILQAGVGGMAGAMVAGIANYLDYIPTVTVVEPDSAACVLESIRNGKIKKIDIKKESLMGGMSCGEVSLIPWEILKSSIKYCISLPDDDIAKTMKLFSIAKFSKEKIIAGENAVPGVVSLIACCKNKKIKEKIQLNKESNVLLIGCEGDTDKKMYQKLINL